MNNAPTNPQADGDAADPRLPDEVVAALRRDDSRWKFEVPAARETQLLAACRAELDQRLTAEKQRDSTAVKNTGGSRIIFFPQVWLRWVAAAAAVVVVGFVLMNQQLSQPPANAINLDQPTIVDALALARIIETRAVRDTQFDLNGDGHMDQADVDWLARRAVQLPEGGAL